MTALEAIPPHLMVIVEEVSSAFSVTALHLLGASRMDYVARARFACWVIGADQGFTRRQMARAFKRKDSGTIRHGIIRARKLIKTNKVFAQGVRKAMEQLEAKAGKEGI